MTTIVLEPPCDFINANDRQLVAEFTVPGEPVSKARARFTGYGSKVRTYTPANVVAAERKIAAAYRENHGLHNDPELAFGLEVEFLHETGQRRDIDNMVKAVMDALNEVAWPDDVQVTTIQATKRRVPKGEAETRVWLFTLGQIDKPRGRCINCGTEFAQYASTASRKYCTRACGYEHRKAQRERTCVQCGDAFKAWGQTKETRFCSIACNSAHKRVTLNCLVCQQDFTKPRSLANKGVAACSEECRAAYHRANRTVAARGTCADCGGPTSKKQAIRCRACHVNGPARVTVTITPLETP